MRLDSCPIDLLGSERHGWLNETLLRHADMRASDRVELLRISARGIERLSRLASWLLSYGWLRAGRLHPRRVPTVLVALTTDVCVIIRRGFELARLGFVLHIHIGDLPELVEIDPDLSETVLYNLRSNADGNTLHGTVTVDLCAVDDSFVLKVTDAASAIHPMTSNVSSSGSTVSDRTRRLPPVADEGLVHQVIQKPFPIAEIVAAVGRLLGGARSATGSGSLVGSGRRETDEVHPHA